MKVTAAKTVVCEIVHLGTQTASACLPFAMKALAATSVCTASYLSYRQVEAKAMPKVAYHLFNYWVRGIRPTLFDAIERGDAHLFEALLLAGCDPRGQNSDGDTPLHLAASERQVEIVKRLLKDPRVDVNARNQHCFTPIHQLLRRSIESNLEAIEYKKIAKMLLNDPRVDLNARAVNGETPLHSAAKNCFSKDVIILLVAVPSVEVNARDSLGNTPLHYSRLGFIAKYLLERLDIELDILNNQGVTPLLMALKKRDKETVKILAYGGAKFIPSETPKETELRGDVYLGDEEKAISLLKKGGSLLNSPSPIPYLHWACQNKQYSLVVQLILAARREMAMQVMSSRGYLHGNAHQNQVNERIACRRFFDFLDAFGYDEGERETALYFLFANYRGPKLDGPPSHEQIKQLEAQHPELIAIRLLLESGVRLLPDEINGRLIMEKRTPLERACGITKNFVLLYYLDQNRGWLDQQDNKGFTPLQRAVKEVDPDSIEFLIHCGAKLKGDEMKTALFYSNPYLVNALLKHPDFVITEEEKKFLKERYSDGSGDPSLTELNALLLSE